MKTKFKAALLATSLITGIAMSAQADEVKSTFYSQVGNWQIYSDPSADNGCYATTGYSNLGPISLRIGLYSNNGYLMLTNSNWSSIVSGQSYQINVRFVEGQAASWTATGHRLRGSNAGTLLIPFSNPQLWQLLMTSQGVTMWANGTVIFRGLLTGSAAAMSAVTDCQRAYASAPSPRDPFASASPDPFASSGPTFVPDPKHST